MLQKDVTTQQRCDAESRSTSQPVNFVHDGIFRVVALLIGVFSHNYRHIRLIQQIQESIPVGYVPPFANCTYFSCHHQMSRGQQQGEEGCPRSVV